MESSTTATVRETLSGPEVHATWEKAFRTRANEAFYERVFDRLLELVAAPKGAHFLDVGCGPGFHALRLARRSYRVHAVDASPAVLEEARRNVHEASLEDRISVSRQDLLALSLPDAEAQYVLCWGVLMHIPEVGRAVAELSRVLAPGGALVVSEGNMYSLEEILKAVLTRLRRRPPVGTRRAAGREAWDDTAAGPIMTRRADIAWLARTFADHGLTVTHRVPGQFTELYTWSEGHSPRLTRALHRVNDLWFWRVGRPELAFGNILVMRKFG